MQALDVWKTVTMDKSNFLDNLIALLSERQIRYCVIGGQGVNAYVDPLISLDLDLVVALSQLELVESLLAQHFKVERFPNSLNVSAAGSSLRVQNSYRSSLLRIRRSGRCPGRAWTAAARGKNRGYSSGQDLGRYRSQPSTQQAKGGSAG